MRAILVQRLGPPEVLEMAEVLRPEPGPGQVLVHLHATGVNFADTERRRGVYKNLTLPWMPGTEGAGRVVAVGPDTDLGLIDRRVAFWAMPPAVSGTYAEYAVAPADALFHLTDAVPFDLGAALPVQGLTAYGLAFFATTLRPGASVLIHAAAGGVGQILVQLARRQGARVLGTVSSLEKAATVTRLGAEAFLHGPDLPERVAQATGGRGVDRVFDSIGKATQAQSLAMLAPYGELIHFGEASGPPDPVDPDQLYDRCLKVGAFGLYIDDPPTWAIARRNLLTWVAVGELQISITHRLPLAEAAEAHRLLEGRATTGKIVLLPGEG
ncbi:MAG TPA: quinone oxidoreductase [Thermoanaerobaculia bacterium]|nr:quinone oxidoreductase [Thermoanaerobaculia bacterium]